MQQPVQITFRGLGRSEAIEQRVRAKVDDLEKFYDGIIGCRVTVSARHRRRQTGNLYSVRVDVKLPDKTLIAGRERHKHQAHEDVYVAMRDTFDAAVRQLEDYARIRRRKVKRHEVPDHGQVCALFPRSGFGFVRRLDGTEVYFHQNSVVGDAFGTLSVGDEVRIVIAEGEGEKGPQASTITPIGKHHLLDEIRPT